MYITCSYKWICVCFCKVCQSGVCFSSKQVPTTSFWVFFVLVIQFILSANYILRVMNHIIQRSFRNLVLFIDICDLCHPDVTCLTMAFLVSALWVLLCLHPPPLSGSVTTVRLEVFILSVSEMSQSRTVCIQHTPPLDIHFHIQPVQSITFMSVTDSEFFVHFSAPHKSAFVTDDLLPKGNFFNIFSIFFLATSFTICTPCTSMFYFQVFVSDFNKIW